MTLWLWRESGAVEGMPNGMAPRASFVTARQALPSELVFCRTGTQQCLKNCRRGGGARDPSSGQCRVLEDVRTKSSIFYAAVC